MNAIVDEAHRKGHKVSCHAFGGEGLHNCLNAGVDTLEHGVLLEDSDIKMMVDRQFTLKIFMMRPGFDQNAPTLQFIQSQENSGYGKFIAASGSQIRDGVFSGQERSQNGVTLAIKNALSMFVQEKQRRSDNVGVECGPKARP